jgi:hypothetical protein
VNDARGWQVTDDHPDHHISVGTPRQERTPKYADYAHDGEYCGDLLDAAAPGLAREKILGGLRQSRHISVSERRVGCHSYRDAGAMSNIAGLGVRLGRRSPPTLANANTARNQREKRKTAKRRIYQQQVDADIAVTATQDATLHQ